MPGLRFIPSLRCATAALICAACFHAPALAQNQLFFEGFDGGYAHIWDATPGIIPTETTIPLVEQQSVTHVGDIGRSWITVDGYPVLQANVVQAASWSRYGAVTTDAFALTYGTVEARINTLDQNETNIDGLFELWLLNADDHTKNVHVALFSDNNSVNRSWIYTLSGSEFPTVAPDTLPPFEYADNTWYRVRITQLPGFPLRVSVWSDDALTQHVCHEFDTTLTSVGSRFQIGISQFMGGPHLTNSLLSAVDYVWVTASYDPGDLTGDGVPDLLLQNQDDRRTALLTMSGGKIASSKTISPTLPANWRVAAVGDFNSDGLNEIVVQNSSTRQISLLFLNGTTVQYSVPVNPVLPPNWQVRAAADLTGDGRADLIVQNTTTQQIASLQMDYATVVKSRSFSQSLPAGWLLCGVADFDGDGRVDLVAQNGSTRQVAILTLFGQTITGSFSLSPTLPANWSVQAVGDYNGDGKPDLVVQNGITRQISVLSVANRKFASSVPVTPTAPAGWKLVGPR
jgi:hypothetical protein